VILSNQRFLPLLLGSLIAIGPVSVDMYLPAFPTIAREFHEPSAPGLSLAAYFAGLAIGQMSQGPFSDRIGRRTPILLGLLIYTIASVGCALAWNGASLSVFRLLAAFGGSAAVVIPRAMVRDLADGPAAAMLFSKLMLVMGAAPIIAPIIGSSIVMLGSWRWIFVIAAAYGIAGILLTRRFLPDTLPLSRRSIIDFRSVLIRYAEITIEPGFLSNALTGTFAIAALFAYLAGTPGIFIGMFHWSPIAYASLFAANAAAYIACNQWNPHLVVRIGLARVINISVALLVFGTACLLLGAVLGAGAGWLIAALLICQSSYGFVLPSSLVAALSRHQAHAGSASALMGTWQYLAGALAGAIVGAFDANEALPMAIVMFTLAIFAAIATRFRPNELIPVR